MHTTLIIGKGFLGGYLAEHLEADTLDLGDATFTGSILDDALVAKAVQGKTHIIYTIGFSPTEFSRKKHELSLYGLTKVLAHVQAGTKISYISAIGADINKKTPIFQSERRM